MEELFSFFSFFLDYELLPSLMTSSLFGFVRYDHIHEI